MAGQRLAPGGSPLREVAGPDTEQHRPFMPDLQTEPLAFQEDAGLTLGVDVAALACGLQLQQPITQGLELLLAVIPIEEALPHRESRTYQKGLWSIESGGFSRVP